MSRPELGVLRLRLMERYGSIRAAPCATGDREVPAEAIATALGIDEVHARCTPEGKAALVRTLQEEGLRVAVVGDGVNDAAALAGADLGIAMGSGTDVAIGAADVTLVRGDIEALPDAVRLARRTLGTIRANLVWAFGYNVVTVPLAMVGLLNPMPAAAAMSVSSLLVDGEAARGAVAPAVPPHDAGGCLRGGLVGRGLAPDRAGADLAGLAAGAGEPAS